MGKRSNNNGTMRPIVVETVEEHGTIEELSPASPGGRQGELERNQSATDAAVSGASDAAIWKALKGRKGRRALNDLITDRTAGPGSMPPGCNLAREGGPGSSLEQILGSLPPPPEGASEKEYAAYAVAAAQYTQQAAAALKERGGPSLLPGMEEAAALLRASGAVGPSGGPSSAAGAYPYFYSWGGGGYGGPGPAGPPPAVSGGGKKGGKKDKQKDILWDIEADKREQEKLKEFWMTLGHKERQELVKIEKHAILKEMKGQQKYICSCSVCGRRREVLEEELEMLYDAYYEELADQQQLQDTSRPAGKGALPPARKAGRLLGAPRDARRPISDDDDASDLDDDEDYDDLESLDDEATLASSLTVRGDVLTVSDEFLENGGSKFFDLMVKIADSRFHYREGDLDSDSAFGDEDDFDDLSEEDSEYLEEQRMEEGRRMFQMFAARMIEQRLLVAFREKAALEAQERLIAEEEEAGREKQERAKLKREKEKEKKKKKKEQKKAQKAAGEAAKKEAAERDARAKRELKLKREAERLADLAERQRRREEEESERNEELARRAAELQAEAIRQAKAEGGAARATAKAAAKAKPAKVQAVAPQRPEPTVAHTEMDESEEGVVTLTKHPSKPSPPKAAGDKAAGSPGDRDAPGAQGWETTKPSGRKTKKKPAVTVEVTKPALRPAVVADPQPARPVPTPAPAPTPAPLPTQAETKPSDDAQHSLDSELSNMLELLPGDLLGGSEGPGRAEHGDTHGGSGQPADPQGGEPLAAQAAHWQPRHSAGRGTWQGPGADVSGRKEAAGAEPVKPQPSPWFVPSAPTPSAPSPQASQKQTRLVNVMALVCSKVHAGQLQLPLGVDGFWMIAQQVDPFFRSCAVSVQEVAALWAHYHRQFGVQLAQAPPGVGMGDQVPCIVGVLGPMPAHSNAAAAAAFGGAEGGAAWPSVPAEGVRVAHKPLGVPQAPPGMAQDNGGKGWGAFDGLNISPSYGFL